MGVTTVFPGKTCIDKLSIHSNGRALEDVDLSPFRWSDVYTVTAEVSGPGYARLDLPPAPRSCNLLYGVISVNVLPFDQYCYGQVGKMVGKAFIPIGEYTTEFYCSADGGLYGQYGILEIQGAEVSITKGEVLALLLGTDETSGFEQASLNYELNFSMLE